MIERISDRVEDNDGSVSIISVGWASVGDHIGITSSINISSQGTLSVGHTKCYDLNKFSPEQDLRGEGNIYDAASAQRNWHSEL